MWRIRLFYDRKTTISSLEELVSIGDIIEATKVDLSSDYADYAVAYKIRYKSDDCEVIGYIVARKDDIAIPLYIRGFKFYITA